MAQVDRIEGAAVIKMELGIGIRDSGIGRAGVRNVVGMGALLFLRSGSADCGAGLRKLVGMGSLPVTLPFPAPRSRVPGPGIPSLHANNLTARASGGSAAGPSRTHAPSSSRAAQAMARWPRWIGSKVPP
ncbi:hypothetical protein XAC29_14170 [Xanthomonas axonopodis Xac29-1]|nr:hypothetical protein XAC29_14170 [Xanthomonas axonopodis Xac29-1]